MSSFIDMPFVQDLNEKEKILMLWDVSFSDFFFFWALPSHTPYINTKLLSNVINK